MWHAAIVGLVVLAVYRWMRLRADLRQTVLLTRQGLNDLDRTRLRAGRA